MTEPTTIAPTVIAVALAEIKVTLHEVKADLAEVKQQTTRTNGRVTTLETAAAIESALARQSNENVENAITRQQLRQQRLSWLPPAGVSMTLFIAGVIVERLT